MHKNALNAYYISYLKKSSLLAISMKFPEDIKIYINGNNKTGQSKYCN